MLKSRQLLTQRQTALSRGRDLPPRLEFMLLSLRFVDPACLSG
jgi:hypothetical protein